jgi:hypothetical protein
VDSVGCVNDVASYGVGEHLGLVGGEPDRITHQMRYALLVRTTLDIDDEVLLTVKQIARQRNTTAGIVVSALLRESLQPKSFAIEYRDGVPILPRRAPVVTTELVNELLNEDE